MRRIQILVTLTFVFAALFFSGFEKVSEAYRAKAGSVPIDAPTGVQASNGDYADKVGINWNTMKGANLYRVFRNTVDDFGSATEVGTTPANYFFDTSATVSQNYFYWVRAENGSNQSAASSSASGLRASAGAGSWPFEALQPPPAPVGNPVTASKAALGKTLFWDEQISSTKTVACGTCHRPTAGGADPRSNATDLSATNPGPDGIFGNADDIQGSPGVIENIASGTYNWNTHFGLGTQVTGRRAPTYLNAGYAHLGSFWDGRAAPEFRDPITNAVVLDFDAALESQAAAPPVSGAEMGHSGRDWNDVATRVQNSTPLALASDVPASLAAWIDGRTYPELFEEAYGSPEVTPAKILMAIATHERTIFSDRTPLDRAAAGIEPLQPLEDEGRKLFIISNCNFCHQGPLLTDQLFNNIGVRPQADDAGRFAVSGAEEDRGSFKTPNLRNVALKGAYMHNGRFPTLMDVVDFYSRGGDFPEPNINTGVIFPRNFSPEEKAALVAFMGRPLTDPRVANGLPPFDRPTLFTETDRVPVVSGTGRTGTGALEPKMVAIEPPLAGNTSFTVAVSDALAGAQATLVIDSADPGVGSSIPASGSLVHQTITTATGGGGVGYGSISVSLPSNIAGQTFYGRWYVVDPVAASGFSVSPLVTFTAFGSTAAANGYTRFDFDGDSKADVSIFRPGPGEWWYLRSSDSGNNAFQFGSGTDLTVPGDYTGDGRADFAFWRPSTGEWYILRSEDSSFYAFPFGTTGDIPAPGDFDGDGTTDVAVFRPSSGVWYIMRSSDNQVDTIPYGSNGDKPLVGDYDNDGKDDVAIYREADHQYWINRSTAGNIVYQFGTAGDQQFADDFTGDGTADVGFFRPSTGEWYILRSDDQTFFAFPFGTNGDIPAPADFDGDGIADATVFRPSTNTWYSNQTTSGVQVTPFGSSGDHPVPSSYVIF
ncbi:MAG: cytochrome c peroxidase [Pyrinomonadaceae bacterium]